MTPSEQETLQDEPPGSLHVGPYWLLMCISGTLTLRSIARAFGRSVPNTRLWELCPVVGLRKQVSRLKGGVRFSSECYKNPGMNVILAGNQSSV